MNRMVTRPILVVNPADDHVFGLFAEMLVEHGAASTSELECRLRPAYSKAVVHARTLSSEPFIIWYVYRDGQWVNSRREGPVDPGGRLADLLTRPHAPPIVHRAGRDAAFKEVPMNAFLIDVENRPGELARVTEAIAAKGADIMAVSGTTMGDRGKVAIITDDEEATSAALRGAGCSFRMTDAAEISLRGEPGALARATRRLAEGEVNIEAIMVIGMNGNEVKVVFVTDAPAKAKTILAMSETALR